MSDETQMATDADAVPLRWADPNEPYFSESSVLALVSDHDGVYDDGLNATVAVEHETDCAAVVGLTIEVPTGPQKTEAVTERYRVTVERIERNDQ